MIIAGEHVLALYWPHDSNDDQIKSLMSVSVHSLILEVPTLRTVPDEFLLSHSMELPHSLSFPSNKNWRYGIKFDNMKLTMKPPLILA